MRENSLGKWEKIVAQSAEFASPVSGRLSKYASSPDGPGTTVAPCMSGLSRTPTVSRVSTEK